MSNTLIFIEILLLVIVGFIWGMAKIAKSTGITISKLTELKEKAKLAKTKEELEILWEELKEVEKECWHESFSYRVIEVKTILETKHSML